MRPLVLNPSSGLFHDRSPRRAEDLRPAWARIAPLACSLLLVGCSEEPGVPKFPVSGKVTIDGKPLEKGAISFLPTASGPATSARIEEGAFSLDRAEGPGSGPYKVEIISVQSTGKRVPDPDDPSIEVEETRNIIPVRYNAQTQLQVSVRPDGENSYRFDISSQEPKPRARQRRRR